MYRLMSFNFNNPAFLYPLFVLLGHCNARPWYQTKIPNGEKVPNPTGGIAPGVGHVSPGGGGPRNPFGLDFQANGYEWTTVLCESDSDGDGRTNGEELGDPDCVWEEGDQPEGPAVSHPGVVDEPGDGGGGGVFDSCDDYERPSDAFDVEFRFTDVQSVGSDPTYYRCEQKTVKIAAGEYHQVRTDVVKDNDELLHHMWIYLCDGTESTDGNMVDQGSYSCNGMEGACTIIAGYAVGGDSTCEPTNIGTYLDFSSGSATIKIEAHYDNARGVPQQDRSGIQVTLTPTLRRVDNGIIIIGKNYWDKTFSIPPQQEKYQHTGVCPAVATKRLSRPMFVYSWNPHMHLYGTKLVTEHYRCGKKIGTIGDIENYDFDFQQTYLFEKPVRILPGDVLKTTCEYNTLSTNQAVLGGESTSEEMCDNYLGYYPYAGYQGNWEFFQSCFVYPEGYNPAFYDEPGYDQPQGETGPSEQNLFYQWSEDPSDDLPLCCASDSCESFWAQPLGQPCGADDHCISGHCVGRICVRSSAPCSLRTRSQSSMTFSQFFKKFSTLFH